MRFIAGFAAVAIVALSACDSPPAQNSPPDEALVNATRTDQAYPSEATGNDIISGDEAATAAPAGEQGGQPAGPPPQ